LIGLRVFLSLIEPGMPSGSNRVVDSKTLNKKVCEDNLAFLESIKFELVKLGKCKNGDVVASQDYDHYLGPGGLAGLKCPDGGTYTLNTIGKPVECSVKGHHLPEDWKNRYRSP